MTYSAKDYFLPGGVQCEGPNGHPLIGPGIRCSGAAVAKCEHVIGYKPVTGTAIQRESILCGKFFCEDCGDRGGEGDPVCEECDAKVRDEMRAEYELDKQEAWKECGGRIPDYHPGGCSIWLGGNCDCILRFID
jgi:hypothetical protein